MKYALKALVEIVNTQEEYITAIDISKKANIPYKFLEQILTELRRGHIINSKKGNAGGHYLLKDPKSVNLADIYRLIDGPIALVPCASLNFYEPCKDCPSEETCMVRLALVKVGAETSKALQSISIEDLAKGGSVRDTLL